MPLAFTQEDCLVKEIEFRSSKKTETGDKKSFLLPPAAVQRWTGNVASFERFSP